MLTIWILTLLWALTATVMVIKNPLPIPDRGHRLFGVPDQRASDITVQILSNAGIPLRFRFKTGPTLQALLWDNQTVIHLVEHEMFERTGLSGNGISLPSSNPRQAAEDAIRLLQGAGFSAELVAGFDDYLPPNHLVIVRSTAFLGWALAFRKHVLGMPKPQFVSASQKAYL